jgi:tetratricopeptide (TPR) repeat protein
LAAIGLTITIASAVPAQARRAVTAKVIGAEPRAIVYVDDLRFGRTDPSGEFLVSLPSQGTHTVLVRQIGFADSTHSIAFTPSRQAAIRPKKVPLKDAAELIRQRGEDLLVDGKYKDAVPQFQAALEARKGDFPRAQIGLARAKFGLKQFEDVTSLMTQVLEPNPKDIEARTLLGMAYRERGFYEEAAAEYRKAIALAPGRTPEAHTGLAIALEELGDAAGAVEELERGIAQNLDAEPLLYQLLGAYCEKLERRAEAVAAYDRFLELAPAHSLAPAVRSILERLRVGDENVEEDGDVNPYAPPS